MMCLCSPMRCPRHSVVPLRGPRLWAGAAVVCSGLGVAQPSALGTRRPGTLARGGPAVGSAPGGGGAGQGCDSLWGKVDLRLKCRGGRGLQPRSGQCCFEESGSDWVTVS